MLNRVSEAWQTQKRALLEQGAEVMKAIADAVGAEGTSHNPATCIPLFRLRFGFKLLCTFLVHLRLLSRPTTPAFSSNHACWTQISKAEAYCVCWSRCR